MNCSVSRACTSSMWPPARTAACCSRSSPTTSSLAVLTAGWSRSATAAESSCCTTLRASDGRCVRWRKRIWRCPEPACARRTWTEVQPYATPCAKLTARATSWAVDPLRHDDTTVSAIARHLGVAWDSCWSAIKADAQTRIAEPDRLKGIKTIGVDEHIWRPSKITSTDKAVTVMVDLTRDEHGCLQARLLMGSRAVRGRSTPTGSPNTAWT